MMMHRVKTQAVPLYGSLGSAAEASYVRSLKWSILGRDRSLPHLGRKFYHFLMGILCFSLYAFFLTKEQALFTLLTIGGAFAVGDFIRLRSTRFNALVLRLFGKLMRREELKSISGNTFFVFGLLTVLLFFPKPIVLLSVLYLAIGDPVAAVVGSLYGTHKLIGKKSLQGALANFACTSFATFIFCYLYMGYSSLEVIPLALAGGLVSVISELFPAPVDDNFSIPVLSGLLLTLVFSVFSIL